MGDTWNGAGGNDVLNGGESRDYVQGRSGLDVAEGGTGADRLDATDCNGDFVISLETGVTNFAGEPDTLFEAVHAGYGNDSLTGTSGAKHIHGSAGFDVITVAIAGAFEDGGDDGEVLDNAAFTANIAINRAAQP